MSIPTIYRDSLLSASLVIHDATGWWIVPNVAGGWHRRLPLTMTPEARAERLTVASVDAAWLGLEAPRGVVGTSPAWDLLRVKCLTDRGAEN